MSVFVVVSDQFCDFTSHCGALSFSEACEKLRSGNFALDDVFVMGQGLSEIEKVSLEAVAHLRGATQLLALWRNPDVPAAAPLAITHKRRAENILISTPVSVATDQYRSHLLLSAQNELLLDHTTGQHVQGMVLIEACRQMFIAVSELSHMGDDESRKSYVVFNDISAKFLAFTFPVPAEVEYRLVKREDTRTDRIAIAATLSVWQSGTKTTEVDVTYTLFEPALLKPKEIAKGMAAVNAYAEAVQESIQPQALVG